MVEEKIGCPAFSICEALGTSRGACRDFSVFTELVSKKEPTEIQVAKVSSITLLRAQGCLSSIVLLLARQQNR
jgi:hypothetical protein